MLPDRPADANKGTFGSVLVVAGSLNYVGAPVLATLGAMRVGVGLATLATPFELLPMVSAKLTECTFRPLPSDMGVLNDRAVASLQKALNEREYKALLVGNGLGREKETLNFMRKLLDEPSGATAGTDIHPARSVGFTQSSAAQSAERHSERVVGFASPRDPATHGPATADPEAALRTPHSALRTPLPPLVLDADGLNLLHQLDGWVDRLPPNTILTPHPGEMAHLLDSDVDTVQADRTGTAQRAAADWKAVVVLKGAHTVIASPDGRVQVNPTASPALATAGTGDVLAGVIAGLLAQGMAPFDAAVAGVFVHGRAGELVAEDLGDAGALAGDVADALPYAIRDIKDGHD